MNEQGLQITKLRILNFMGISTLVVDKLGQFNKITGKNGAGKTSVIKAIQELAVSFGVNPDHIRYDEKMAELYCEIMPGDIKIKRLLTMETNNLTVTKAGKKVEGGPQKFLDNIFHISSFDIVSFLKMNGRDKDSKRKRRNMLLTALPYSLTPEWLIKALQQYGEVAGMVDASQIDFSQHGLDVLLDYNKCVYKTRTEQNGVVDQLTKSIRQDKQEIPAGFKTKEANQDLSAINAERDKIMAARSAHALDLEKLDKIRASAKALVDENNKLEEENKRIDEEIIALQKRQTNNRAAIKENRIEFEAFKDEAAPLKTRIDEFDDQQDELEDLEAQLKDFQLNQELNLKVKAIAKREAGLEAETEKAKQLDNLYNHVKDELPKTIISELKLPIPGLTFEDDDIYLNNVNILDLSDSETIALAVKFAQVVSGGLQDNKVNMICVNGFEAFDSASQQAFYDANKDSGWHFMLTEVSDDPEAKINVLEFDQAELKPEPTTTKKKKGKKSDDKDPFK